MCIILNLNVVTLKQYAAWRKQNCIGPAYHGTCIRVHAYVSMYAEARRVWGYDPPGKFFEVWMLRDGFWGYFGAKNITTNLLKSWHGNKILIHFTSARMEIEVSIGGFKPPWNDAKEWPTKPVRILLSILSYRIASMPAENVCMATVLKIC